MHAVPRLYNKLARSWGTSLRAAVNGGQMHCFEHSVVRVDGLLVVLGVKGLQDADRARYRLLEALLVPAVPLSFRVFVAPLRIRRIKISAIDAPSCDCPPDGGLRRQARWHERLVLHVLELWDLLRV